MTTDREIVEIDYTNWRGERRLRKVRPLSISFENSKWHPDTQWILYAVDLERFAAREFAMKCIHSWRPVDAAAKAIQSALPLWMRSGDAQKDREFGRCLYFAAAALIAAEAVREERE